MLPRPRLGTSCTIKGKALGRAAGWEPLGSCNSRHPAVYKRIRALGFPPPPHRGFPGARLAAASPGGSRDGMLRATPGAPTGMWEKLRSLRREACFRARFVPGGLLCVAAIPWAVTHPHGPSRPVPARPAGSVQPLSLPKHWDAAQGCGCFQGRSRRVRRAGRGARGAGLQALLGGADGRGPAQARR